MLDITLLGTGGTYPLPERALTSLYVRYEGRAMLIDCGEGTQVQLRKLGLRFKPIEAILITHFHADHMTGLPGLLLTLGNEGRTEPLTMYGPVGLEQTVNSLRAIFPFLPFEIQFRELPMVDAHLKIIGLDVDVFPGNHDVDCLGYCLNVNRPGKFDPLAAKAKGIPQRLWGRLQKGESLEGFTPADVLGAPRRGLKVLYCTDTRPVPGIETYGKDADLLILEGMFGEHDKQERAEISHHMMMQEAAQFASRLNAAELWLTHYSPATSDPEQFGEELKGIFENTVISRDGQAVTLQFQD